uniref:Phosphoinositide phospholipase C n=1 Tax=Nothobranchius rachovii TaxID=451742 RepID=A0A1A8SNC5_9TELE
MKSSDSIKSLGLMDNEDIGVMMQGSSMVKVRSLRWQKSRSLRLLEDGLTVWCESTKRSSKAKSQQTFAITEVECVREGCQSEALRRLSGSVPDNQCFTVVFSGARKSLDLRCHSADEAQRWVRGLRFLKHQVASMTQKEKLDHWIQSYLRRADENRDGKMTYDEVKRLLQMINIDLSEQYSRNLFKRCDRSGDGRLDHSEIEGFCRELMRRPELDAVFRHYSSSGSVLSIAELRDFLGDQGEDASLKHAQSLIMAYELNDWAQKNKFMTQNGFAMYMLSLENDVFNPSHARVYQDMRRPLAHYFISSSHNTYLTKDQVTSASSTEPYIRALNQGCRCVELDCWDGPHGEPVIYHGHTLTSKVLFKDVIKAIKDYAFKMSEYPVILSLENHCAVDQQKIMARYLKSILGDALVTKPLGGKMPTNFPSPKELKGKFLIKGKRLNKLDVLFSNNNTVEDEMVSEEDEAAECKENSQKQKPKKSKITLAKELSDVVIYCKSVHFSSFEHAQSNQAFYEMSSFKESKALMLAETSATAFIHHNMDKLSRIYPSGSRTDSSNYNPVPMWNVGCQIVALNFQTPSKEMHINQGRFRPNGFCGYILKPEFQRSLSSQFNPNTVSNRPEMKIFHVMVITAQQLPKINKEKEKSIVDPLVKVEIYGVPADNACKETQYINNNGFNPMWNERFEFTIQVPELAIVRFLVEDYDAASANDFIGMYCLPLTSVQNGYRHIPLLTKRGDIIPSAGLFVHLMLLDAQ